MCKQLEMLPGHPVMDFLPGGAPRLCIPSREKLWKPNTTHKKGCHPDLTFHTLPKEFLTAISPVLPANEASDSRACCAFLPVSAGPPSMSPLLGEAHFDVEAKAVINSEMDAFLVTLAPRQWQECFGEEHIVSTPDCRQLTAFIVHHSY